MALGPGKYDAACTLVREACKADGVVVIVFGGDKGPGFSCQATPAVTLTLPTILREVANQIEASLKQGRI